MCEGHFLVGTPTNFTFFKELFVSVDAYDEKKESIQDLVYARCFTVSGRKSKKQLKKERMERRER